VHALVSELQLCATAAHDRCAAVGQTVGQTVDDDLVLKHWEASVHYKMQMARVQLQQGDYDDYCTAKCTALTVTTCSVGVS
jgi:hypothetical protein